MTTIALIGCCSKKLDRPAPARDLYLSNLFKLSVAYAESRDLPWLVLSAKWGLVDPDQVLEPYELSLVCWRDAELRRWGVGVAGELNRRFPGARYVFLAGSRYWAAVSSFGPARVESPLDRLQIGDRLSFLKRAIA